MSSTKIALALPLAFGIACSTTGQQASTHTGAMWTLYQPSDGGQESDRPPRGTGAEVSPAQGLATAGAQDGLSIQPVAGSTDSSSGSSGSTGSSGSSDSTGSRGSPGPSDSGSASGSSGTTDSPMGAIDPAPGSAKGSSDSAGSADTQGHADHGQQGKASGTGDAMAHSDDQLLRGKVSKVSKEEISITPKGGEAKTLKIRPETTVTINGKDAKPTQLKQGQMVRASYSNQDGEDVAVKIEVGKARQGKSGAMGKMKGHQGGAASPTGGDGSTGRSGGSTGGPSGTDSGTTGGSR